MLYCSNVQAKNFLHKQAKRGYPTDTFSHDARAEAIRDGTLALDLVDGQGLAELLKRHELGVRTVVVEKVVVDGEWFGGI